MPNFLVWCNKCQTPIFRENMRDAEWAVKLHLEAEDHEAVIFVNASCLAEGYVA